MRRRGIETHWLWLTGLALAACSDTTNPTPAGCVAGQTAACVCAGGASGVQSCGASGAFGACVCGPLDGAVDVPNDSVQENDVRPTDMGPTDNGTADAPTDSSEACDQDGDGVRSVACDGTDCDDHDAERYPGFRERCDGMLPSGRSAANHDEDCNPCTVTGAAPDGDADRDGYPAGTCINPWASVSRPAGCNETLVRIDDAAMRVSGADCNDSPDPVVRDGGAPDASDDATAADGGTSTVTGREIRPNQTEVCDGLDNNCNGPVDEGDPGGGGTCGSGLPGVCAPGVLHCSAGSLGCTPNVHPGERSETCNATDDDCDGTVDNGDPGGGASCVTTQPGVCAPGTMHCQPTRGVVECGANASASAEVCDGLDNNCNGTVDDGAVASCTPPANAVATCTGGRCGFACSPSFGDCDGNPANGCEMNTSSSTTNCGSCRHACSAGASCSGGGCTCPGGGSDCGGTCRNLSTDPGNCGRCGNVCATGRVCSAGSCTCTGGQTDCGGTCRSLLSDATNCGACGTVCAAGGSCSGGACTCPGGGSVCSNVCHNLQTEVANCGACGRSCVAPSGGSTSCSSGTCLQTCPPTAPTNCSGTCRAAATCTNGLSGLCTETGNYGCNGGSWTCPTSYGWPGRQTYSSGFATNCITTTQYGLGFSPPPPSPAYNCLLQYGPGAQLHSGSYNATYVVRVNGPIASASFAVRFEVTEASGTVQLGALGDVLSPQRCTLTTLSTECRMVVPFTVPATSTCHTGIEFRILHLSASAPIGGFVTFGAGLVYVDRL